MKNYANRWDLVLSAEETWLVNSSAPKGSSIISE